MASTCLAVPGIFHGLDCGDYLCTDDLCVGAAMTNQERYEKILAARRKNALKSCFSSSPEVIQIRKVSVTRKRPTAWELLGNTSEKRRIRKRDM